MKKKNRVVFIVPLVLLGAFIYSCTEKTYTPKPRGYFNIETPTPEYVKFDTTCPFTMEVSKHAIMIPSQDPKAKDRCWYNVYYPKFDAIIYLTYDPVNNNLKNYLDDS